MAPAPMLRIYPATKLANIGTLRMWEQWYPKELFFHARWLRHVDNDTPDIAENANQFWIEDAEDVRSADALVVFAFPDQHLRGALVECGIAIASGVPVFAIGEHPDFSTWQYHPGVTRVKDISEVIPLVRVLVLKKRGF